MKQPKIKINLKEYNLLKKLHKNVSKWVDVDNGGETVYLKKGTVRTNEETVFQDNFIKCSDKLNKIYSKK